MNACRDRIEQDPGDQEAHERVFELLSEPAHARQLIDFYRQLQRAHPDDWRYLANLAKAYSRTGKDSLAVVQLQKLLRNDPSLKAVWMDLARCYQRLDKIELALRALNSVIEVEPGYAEAHVERVRLLASTGELEEAAAAAIFSLECDGLPGTLVEWLEEVDQYLESGALPPEAVLDARTE